MQPQRRRKVWKWIKILLLIYVAIGVAFYFLQEKILFRPESLPADHVFKFQIPFKEINLAVNNNKNLNIVQFTVPDSLRKGIVLYFHGNRRNIERYAPFASNFTRNNFEAWMIEYPGYGKSTGERTEQIMYDDAKEMYKMARARVGKDSIVIYGRSLGTGVASYLASVRDCKQLILEAPYYSMEALLSHYAFIYPIGLMSKYHFPTCSYLEKVDAPVVIFHGNKDAVIPYKHSKRLIKKVKGEAELITLKDCNHNNVNDIVLYHHKLDSVLKKL